MLLQTPAAGGAYATTQVLYAAGTYRIQVMLNGSTVAAPQVGGPTHPLMQVAKHVQPAECYTYLLEPLHMLFTKQQLMHVSTVCSQASINITVVPSDTVDAYWSYAYGECLVTTPSVTPMVTAGDVQRVTVVARDPWGNPHTATSPGFQLDAGKTRVYPEEGAKTPCLKSAPGGPGTPLFAPFPLDIPFQVLEIR